MARTKIYMETTMVDPAKTAAEIEAVLVIAGATHVMKSYDGAGDLIGMHFKIPVSGEPTPFAIPARIQAIYKLMISRAKYPSAAQREKIVAQAKRTAWRILLRWVQAQIAIVETGMVELGEAFMPYISLTIEGEDGQRQVETFYERMKRIGMDTTRRALPMHTESDE